MAKHIKKRRFNRKRQRPKRIAKIQRGLSPAIYPFKRSISTTIGLNGTAPPEGWSTSGNNLYRNWGFSLAQLGDYSEFTDLFKYYKLKGVRLQMYFSNTNSTARDGTSSPNQQILMWMDTNRDGADIAASGQESTYLTSQTAKKRLCLNTTGRPIDIYMSLRQQNMVYGGPANTDYTTVRPKWIATTEPTTPHYGYKMMLQRVDGQAFTSGITNSQYCKIIQTVYFQCKKVE
jgi:hypothetical protein